MVSGSPGCHQSACCCSTDHAKKPNPSVNKPAPIQRGAAVQASPADSAVDAATVAEVLEGAIGDFAVVSAMGDWTGT